MAVTANCKLKKVLTRSLSGLRKVFFNLVKYRINKTEAFAFLRAAIDENNLDSKPARQLNGTKRTCSNNVFMKTTEIFGGSQFFFLQFHNAIFFLD